MLNGGATLRIYPHENWLHGEPMYVPLPEGTSVLPTRSHDLIRLWAKRHAAAPAEVKGTADGKPARLAFILAGRNADEMNLQPISWADFFARFDLLDLSMSWSDGEFTLVRVEKSLPQDRNSAS